MINKKKIALIGVICVLVVVCVSAVWLSKTAQDDIKIDSSIYYPVSYVVDGDTFKVNIVDTNKEENAGDSKIITVRVLGINTPETVDPRKPVECYGSEASAEAKEILNGHKVKLVFNPGRELKDKYGRYLAYVYRDDALFYNEFMIEKGYAREYTFGSAYSMQKEFRDLETSAQKAKLGLWSKCANKSKYPQ